MSARLIRSAAARRDIADYATYLGERSREAANKFIDAVEQACLHLAEMPESGSWRSYGNTRLSGMRMWPVPGFRRYLIFYRVRDDELEVIRVLHGAPDIAGLFDDYTDDT